MRKIIFLFFFGISIVCHASVIAYWRFEEGEGDIAHDSVGDYHLRFTGWSPNVPIHTIPVTGEANTGSASGGGYIVLEADMSIDLGSQVTIESYLYLTDELVTSDIPLVLICGFSGRFQSSKLQLALGNLSWNDEGGYSVFLLASGANNYPSEPKNVPLGEWFHYAFVQDGNWGGFYVNGELWWSFEEELCDSYAWRGWLHGEMQIGSWGLRMDEFRISDVALLPSQFLCAAIPEPSTLALLALGGGLLAAKRRRK